MTQEEINELLGVKTYNLQDLRDKRRTVLLHARYGRGKTHQASLIPKVLYINIENGDSTLAGGDIVAVKVRTWKKFGTVLNRVAQLVKDGTCPFENIFVDSGPELAKLHLRAMAAVGAAANDKLNPNQPTLGNYFDAMVDHDNMLTWFKDIPLNIIITAGTEWEKDEATGSMLWMPKFSKAIRDSYLQYADAVWYMEFDSQGHRYMRTQGTSNIEAKTRNPLNRIPIPPIIYEPNVWDCLQHFNGVDGIKFHTTPQGAE